MLKLDLSKNILCIVKCIMKLYYEKLQMFDSYPVIFSVFNINNKWIIKQQKSLHYSHYCYD